MILDTFSLMVAGMIVVLMLGVITLLVSRLRSPSDSYRFWTASNFLLAGGFILLGLRDRIPMFWSAVGGNMLLIVSMSGFYEGMRRFYGLRGYSALSVTLVLLGLAGELYLLYGVNDLNGRAFLFAAFAAIMAIACVILIWQRSPQETRSGSLFTTAFWILMAGLMVFRAIYVLAFNPLESLFQDDPVQTVTFVGVIVAASGWNFGFLLMASQQMEASLRGAQAELQRLSITDPLTGVSNRRYFYEVGEKEVEIAHRYRQPLALIFIDTDWFKKINDRHGHLVGDMMMGQLATQLQACLRKADMLGRLGGDEFAILLPMTSLEDAHHTAERLRALVTDIRIRDFPDIRLSASMGVTCLHSDDRSLEDMVRRADNAMYLAKNKGRNRVEVTLGRAE